MLGHRREEIAKRTEFFGAESGGELVLVLACETRNLSHQFFPLGGQVEGIAAAITGVSATLDIPPLFQLVEVADQASGHEPQVRAEGMLAASGLGRDGTQNPGMCRGQLDVRELFGEQRGGEKTKLAQ